MSGSICTDKHGEKQQDTGDSDIDSRQLSVTFFQNAAANTLRVESVTLPTLRDQILATTANTKAELPWLKLAIFGDVRTVKGSLRHDANVIEISGIELDYDAEVVTFDEAAAILRQAGLRALAYTSPSNAPEKPRWRILLPTSKHLPPDRREKLVARTNGLFDGSFADESFTLSQAYYWGSVDRNPAHRAEVIDGDFIDERDDLDAGAIGKKTGRKKQGKSEHKNNANDAIGFEAHLARMGDGDGLAGFNVPLCSASSAYAAKHGPDFDREALKAILRGAIERAPKKPGRDADIARYTSDQYLDALITSAIDKFASDFRRDRHGVIIARSQANVRLAIEKLGVTIRYDEFADRMPLVGLEGFDQLDDASAVRLWLRVDEEFGFRPSFDFFWKVTNDLARRNSYHPVCDFLNSLKWDGVPRIDHWLVKYGGAVDTELTRAISALMPIAAVRRIKQPGCKYDEMVVLESPQGKNKSTALRILAVNDEWFSDDLPLSVKTKEIVETIRGRWIIEVQELNGIRRAEVEHMKTLLSRQNDRARMAYDRKVSEVKRHCVFVGTTNSSEYLRDLTGNRRIWPIKVEQFDIEALERDRDQLWAEASVREAKGESIRLDPELWAAAAAEQDARVADDPFLAALRDHGLGDEIPRGKISSETIWAILDLHNAGQRTQDQNRRVGEAMHRLGWRRPNTSKLVRIKGRRTTGYVKDQEPWPGIGPGFDGVTVVEPVNFQLQAAREYVVDTVYDGEGIRLIPNDGAVG